MSTGGYTLDYVDEDKHDHVRVIKDGQTVLEIFQHEDDNWYDGSYVSSRDQCMTWINTKLSKR